MFGEKVFVNVALPLVLFYSSVSLLVPTVMAYSLSPFLVSVFLLIDYKN